MLIHFYIFLIYTFLYIFLICTFLYLFDIPFYYADPCIKDVQCRSMHDGSWQQPGVAATPNTLVSDRPQVPPLFLGNYFWLHIHPWIVFGIMILRFSKVNGFSTSFGTKNFKLNEMIWDMRWYEIWDDMRYEMIWGQERSD